MSDTTTLTPPYPIIETVECKGCGRCVAACPVKVLSLGKTMNERGYHTAIYGGTGCIGCGNCYYACPEPNALSVRKKPKA